MTNNGNRRGCGFCFPWAWNCNRRNDRREDCREDRRDDRCENRCDDRCEDRRERCDCNEDRRW